MKSALAPCGGREIRRVTLAPGGSVRPPCSHAAQLFPDARGQIMGSKAPPQTGISMRTVVVVAAGERAYAVRCCFCRRPHYTRVWPRAA